MRYSVESSSEVVQQTLPENRTVSIRTFGYFDIFVGDTSIAFRNKKSKELLALLVDRKGGADTLLPRKPSASCGRMNRQTP